MKKINYELDKLERNCDSKAILNEIRRVSNIITNSLITRKEFDKYSKISSSTIVKRFSGWGKALCKAGLSNRYVGLTITNRMHKQKGKRMSNDQLISELQRVAKKPSVKILTMKTFNKYSSINPETIRRRFGSWWSALDKAGLKISNLGKRYSEDDYFENLLIVWTRHGRQPKYREMDEPPSRISSGSYETKWGSWRKALVAFIEKVNSNKITSKKEKQPLNVGIQVKSKNNNPKSLEARTIRLGLRYDVLKRDNFKCVLCGSSPAIDINCKLHIDHIKAFSRGGKTTKENLRTLCLKCNQGKSDKIEYKNCSI